MDKTYKQTFQKKAMINTKRCLSSLIIKPEMPFFIQKIGKI